MEDLPDNIVVNEDLNIPQVPVLCHDVPDGNTNTSGGNALYRWAFTLKSTYRGEGDLDVPIVPEFLAKTLREFCKEFYFQLELSEKGYEHYQGCFSLMVKHRRCEVKNLIGFNNVHLESIKNWKASIRYCSKDETRVEGPWNHLSNFIRVIPDLNWWQTEVSMLLKEEPDDRSIYWIYDTVGNMGKSVFCKWAAVKLGATVLNNGSFSDIAFSLPDSPKIVLFDLPRTIEGRVNYSAIEAVKNGLIFSGKYESKVKLFNPPHILVFANFEPDFSAMSADRWKIINLR